MNDNKIKQIVQIEKINFDIWDDEPKRNGLINFDIWDKEIITSSLILGKTPRDLSVLDFPDFDLYDNMVPEKGGLIDPRIGVTQSSPLDMTCGLELFVHQLPS